MVLWWRRSELCSTGKLVLDVTDIAGRAVELDGKNLWLGFVWFLSNCGLEVRFMMVVSRNVMQVSLTWSLREEAGCDRYILYPKIITDRSKL